MYKITNNYISDKLSSCNSVNHPIIPEVNCSFHGDLGYYLPNITLADAVSMCIFWEIDNELTRI